MTCEHAGCIATATVRCRFGDGLWWHGRRAHRQTFVYYCDDCFQTVTALFVLCDVKMLAQAA